MFFDLAFKGEYTKEDIDLFTPQEEDSTSYGKFTQLIKDQIPDNNPMLGDDEFSVAGLYTYEDDENRKYRIAFYTRSKKEGEYTSVVGIEPGGQIKILGYECVYGINLFRFKTNILLHIHSTSCGEGATGTTLLYKLDGGFEQIYEGNRTCD